MIRHGYAVLDAYFYPYDAATPHDLASVTKTITSVLTGIAVDRGLVRLDRPAARLLSRGSSRPARAEQKITVGNLLRMESGLDCGYVPGEQELEQMKRSPNWVRFALGLPMTLRPRRAHPYCSPGYHLLGSLIGAAAKSSELEFAASFYLSRSAIQGVVWADDPQGRSHGWGDSHFLPGDVAKSVISICTVAIGTASRSCLQSWVTMSTTPPAGRATVRAAWDTNGARPLALTARSSAATAAVVKRCWYGRELDLIVVSMGGGNTGTMAQMVRQAVKSDDALPAE